jgi:hypothetical protein
MRGIVSMSMVVALVVALGACGGSSYKGLSKADFVKQAEAICKAADTKSSTVTDSLQANPSVAQLKSVFTSQLIPILQSEIDDLRALKPPEADRDEIDKMLDNLSEGADQAKAEVQAAKTQADFGKITQPAGMKTASAQAKAYGLPTCGSGG